MNIIHRGARLCRMSCSKINYNVILNHNEGKQTHYLNLKIITSDKRNEKMQIFLNETAIR